MSGRITRREMIGASALVGTGFWVGGCSSGGRTRSPNEKLNVACIGVGGRGASNVDGMAGENLVALCDVDEKRAAAAYKKYPNPRKFRDFRKMLDEMDKQIDAVVVSTPDHTHFHPAVRSMQMGKHLYCEKPMAHSVWEIRTMTRLARRKNLATQLGTQHHGGDNIRRIVELVRSGAIGEVREIYAWEAGDRGMPEIPTEFPPVPEHLDWDLWLGPAAFRPYHPAYCPYLWRFWWDFGTGETGNMGCHILDFAYWALDLKYPVRVEASGPPVHPQTSPKSMKVRFEFPARGDRPPVALHWSHEKEGPAILKERGLPPGDSSYLGKFHSLFVGSKGMLLCAYGKHKLHPEAQFAGFQYPPDTIPKSPGFYQEWIDACKGGQPATSTFDYSGPLAETVVLGNVAYRFGEPFEWDAEGLKAKGKPQADALLRPPFRKGWEVNL